MQPSSLVLVAVVAVWAAYLAPSWLKRREALAGARTHDRFSSGLRVLQRRRPGSSSCAPSGDAVLSSPRMVVDHDGEMLYVPAGRPVAQVRPSSPSPDVTEELAAVETETSADQRVMRRLTSAAAAAAATPSAAGASDRLRDLAVALVAAHAAARRRVVILALLFAATVSSWGLTSVAGVPTWVGVPATVLLVAHLMASRVAGIRSREALAVLAVQARPVAAPVRRPAARPVAPAPAAPAPEVAPERPQRLARRAAAVGETWVPQPVPAPTYTLKEAAPRPEPAPLDLPAAHFPPPPVSPAASAFTRTRPQRGSIPRRAEDIEQILALDPVVNG